MKDFLKDPFFVKRVTFWKKQQQSHKKIHIFWKKKYSYKYYVSQKNYAVIFCLKRQAEIIRIWA